MFERILAGIRPPAISLIAYHRCHMREIPRNRRLVKLVVTAGILIGAGVEIGAPALRPLGAFTTILTALLWIWED